MAKDDVPQVIKYGELAMYNRDVIDRVNRHISHYSLSVKDKNLIERQSGIVVMMAVDDGDYEYVLIFNKEGELRDSSTLYC